MTDNPFTKRTVILLTAVISVSFLGAMLWSVFGSELKDSSAESDSFSRSALGHHLAVALLRELGIPTTVSRHDSGGKAAQGALLVVAEPRLEDQLDRRRFLRMVRRSRLTLLVLRKWHGRQDPREKSRVWRVWPVPEEDIVRPLRLLGIDAELQQPSGGVSWIGDIRPILVEPQLLRGGDIRPIVSTLSGALLSRAETSSGPVVILSDPDIMSNAGLMAPGNAVAFLRLLGEVHSGEPIVIDETLHGFGRAPSLFRALFDFPLLLATVQGLATVAILLWAAMGRFGPPKPADPALGTGKEVLIANTAALLANGGHAGYALRRYLGQSVGEVRNRLNVPGAVVGKEAQKWLDRAAENRKVPLRLGDLAREVNMAAGADNRRIRQVARQIHRWKEEMIRGPDQHP